MSILDFIKDPWEAKTIHWIEPLTGDIVTRCPTCEAEARHSQEQYFIDFRFRHAEWCPVRLRIPWGEA
jgi:hypothetical protein